MNLRTNKTGSAEAARREMLERHGLPVEAAEPEKQVRSLARSTMHAEIEKSMKPIRQSLKDRKSQRRDGVSGSGWRQSIKGHIYKVCPLCGSHLDPGEKCDCKA